MDTPVADFCCLNTLAVPSPEIETEVSEFHRTFSGTSPSRINALPGMLARFAEDGTTATCVLAAVVAPQARWKTIALSLPDGDGITEVGSFLHFSPQPEVLATISSAAAG